MDYTEEERAMWPVGAKNCKYILTTAFTCLSNHGEARDKKFLKPLRPLRKLLNFYDRMQRAPRAGPSRSSTISRVHNKCLAKSILMSIYQRSDSDGVRVRYVEPDIVELSNNVIRQRARRRQRRQQVAHTGYSLLSSSHTSCHLHHRAPSMSLLLPSLEAKETSNRVINGKKRPPYRGPGL
jgi:hypothetical protein